MNGGMSGFQFAEAFRALPIEGANYVGLVAFTGYVSPRVQEQAEAAGFDGCIEKPYSADQLSQTIATYIR